MGSSIGVGTKVSVASGAVFAQTLEGAEGVVDKVHSPGLFYVNLGVYGTLLFSVNELEVRD